MGNVAIVKYPETIKINNYQKIRDLAKTPWLD